jgi:putative tricarboxylic transport membrane protein
MIPIIVVLATIGVYAPDQAVFGMFVALVFCVVGYVMELLGFPIMPMLLGLILGGIMESHFLRAMIMTKRSVLKIFFYSPICTVFTVITAVTILSVIVRGNPKIKNKLYFWRKKTLAD